MKSAEANNTARVAVFEQVQAAARQALDLQEVQDGLGIHVAPMRKLLDQTHWCVRRRLSGLVLPPDRNGLEGVAVYPVMPDELTTPNFSYRAGKMSGADHGLDIGILPAPNFYQAITVSSEGKDGRCDIIVLGKEAGGMSKAAKAAMLLHELSHVYFGRFSLRRMLPGWNFEDDQWNLEARVLTERVSFQVSAVVLRGWGIIPPYITHERVLKTFRGLSPRQGAQSFMQYYQEITASLHGDPNLQAAQHAMLAFSALAATETYAENSAEPTSDEIKAYGELGLIQMPPGTIVT